MLKMNAFSWAILFSLCFLQSSLCQAADDADDDGSILVLGDSWASLSGDFLAGVCGLGAEPGEDVEIRALTNKGDSGSTAAEWASSGNAGKAFENPKYEYDHVWLSIGGNDFIGKACDDSEKLISENIVTVISQIVEATSNDDLNILFCGYGYPSADPCGKGMGVFDDLNNEIRKAIEDSPYAEKVQYVDISSEFVTAESNPVSDKQWYADTIHINEAGYVKLFSMEVMQEFFGCTRSTGDKDRNSSSPSSSGSSRPSFPFNVSSSPSASPISATSAGVTMTIMKWLTISLLGMYYLH
mmetsp:Transcript_867/g.1294  ORF Transcript_867/g.1294 Transcript_867/m.1294 type:complete len:298 (-) Transcript_867:111-1004(-)